MREAIFFDAKTVDRDVANLMTKINLCKEMGWTPKEYGEQKWTDIRKIKNFFKWKFIKEESKASING